MFERFKMANVIALGAMLVGLTVGGARAGADDDLKQKIIGRWSVSADPSCQKTFVLFTANGAVYAIDKGTRTGKYVVVAGRIVLVVAATNPDDPPGIAILHLEGENLKGTDPTGKDPAILTLTRCLG